MNVRKTCRLVSTDSNKPAVLALVGESGILEVSTGSSVRFEADDTTKGVLITSAAKMLGTNGGRLLIKTMSGTRYEFEKA